MDLAAVDDSDKHCIFLVAEVCPLGCGKRIMGKKMEVHCKSECLKRREVCPHGCGESVFAREMPDHLKICPMGKIFQRADSAVALLSLGELNDAVKDIYGARGEIRQRLAAWGHVPIKGGWGSEESADKIKRILRSQIEIQTKVRAKSEDQLLQILAKLKWKKLCKHDKTCVEVFRFLDPDESGQVSSSEWGVLHQLWKELELSILEFLQYIDRTFASNFLMAWEELDDDRSGEIDFEEFTDAIHFIGYFGEGTPIFNYACDKKGYITETGWKKLMDFWKDRANVRNMIFDTQSAFH